MRRASNSADLVLHNGQVITIDSTSSIQQALAIGGETIIAVGSDSDVLGLAGPGTQVINLHGRTVIPGIVDIHAHMDREALKRVYPSLEGARSIDEIIARVQLEVKKKRPGEWVVTMPVGDPPSYVDMPQGLKEGRYPNRWELDRVSPQNPVYLRGIWTPWNVPPSVSIANSRALQAAGIDRHTQSPHSSVVIERDTSGEPTGVFVDHGRMPSLEFTLMRVVPRFTHADRVWALKESMKIYNSVGTTGVYEGHGVAPELLRVYKEVWDSQEMTVRAHLALSPCWKSVADAEDEMEWWGHSASGTGFGDAMLKISGYYIQYKGNPYTFRARSAELPFTGWAGFVQGYNSPQRYRRLVTLAARYNLRVNTTVQQELEDVLRIFEEVHQHTPIDRCRWILVHVRNTTPDQLARIKRLGLVAETIPLTELWLRGSPYLDQPELAEGATAHRSFIEQGLPFGFGTDNKPFNPFVTLWSAVARQERRTGQVLGPSQRLSRMEALRAFTMGGAYFSFDEQVRGSLEPGKLADLAVLSGDPLAVSEDQLPGLSSILTIVGGKVVYQAGDL